MNQSKLPAIISSLVVLAVLGLLGVMLYNRSNMEETAISADATIDPIAETTIDPLDGEQPAIETPASADVDPSTETAIALAETEIAATTEAQAQAESGVVSEVPPPELPTPVIPEPDEVIEGRPPFTIDPQEEYVATITTPRGDIVVRLRPDLAPQTVNSFVHLANEGFYDGLTWHRVIEGFMAQGGDPRGDGTGGAEWSVPAEFSDVPFDAPGVVAMARAQDPDSGSSQFFITTAPAEFLNYQYTVFGEVVEGQELVDNIPLRDPMTATEPGEEIVSIAINEGESTE